METVLFDTIRSRSTELNCPVLAVNGIPDHIHIAVSIPPAHSVSDWVKQIKGASSRTMNMAFTDLDTKFRWQEAYGVLTFGARNLPLVVRYIENQKDHHQAGTVQPYLEQIED